MKRTYKTPKAVLVDFCYDEQVVANSSGDIGEVGDPNDVGVCQQISLTKCLAFWTAEFPTTTCRKPPELESIPGIPTLPI